jgi:hypothetical protein
MSTDLERFYVSNPEGERVYLAFKISHSQMSQTYYFVDDSQDLTVADPNITGGIFTAEAIQYTESVQPDSLDKTATLVLNDYGDTIDTELDAIDIDNTEDVLCTVYKYHNADLSTPQEQTEYAVVDVSQAEGAVTLPLAKPRLNRDGAGLAMTKQKFPMLAGI